MYKVTNSLYYIIIIILSKSNKFYLQLQKYFSTAIIAADLFLQRTFFKIMSPFLLWQIVLLV